MKVQYIYITHRYHPGKHNPFVTVMASEAKKTFFWMINNAHEFYAERFSVYMNLTIMKNRCKIYNVRNCYYFYYLFLGLIWGIFTRVFIVILGGNYISVLDYKVQNWIQIDHNITLQDWIYTGISIMVRTTNYAVVGVFLILFYTWMNDHYFNLMIWLILFLII